MWPRRSRRTRASVDETVLTELRRFYRLTHARKRELIEEIG